MRKLGALKTEGSEKKQNQDPVWIKKVSANCRSDQTLYYAKFQGDLEGGQETPWVVLAGWGPRLVPVSGSTKKHLEWT